MDRHPPRTPFFPYTTLFRSFDPVDFEGFLKLLPQSIEGLKIRHAVELRHESFKTPDAIALARKYGVAIVLAGDSDRKSTRLNSSHDQISYAVLCLKKTKHSY